MHSDGLGIGQILGMIFLLFKWYTIIMKEHTIND